MELIFFSYVVCKNLTYTEIFAIIKQKTDTFLHQFFKLLSGGAREI